MQQLLRLTRLNSRQLRFFIFLLVAGFLLPTTACRTLPPLATVDFSHEGWKIKSGQAVWQVNRETPEIAGEILFARNDGDRIVLQMTKTPFQMVLAQIQGERWQIEFPSENKTYSGRGTPPKRLAWLHLANALSDNPVPPPWRFERQDESTWTLENPQTGETIEGFLE